MKLALANYPRLDLELLRPGARRLLPGYLILALGAMLAIATAVHYLHAIRQMAMLEADMTQSASMPVRDIASSDGEELQVVQAGIARLDLPWGNLFASLEAAAADGIILLSVEPDADNRTVKIVAEAPEVYVMLDYLRKLAGQPALQGVQLTDYAVGDMAEQPVRFTLTASWAQML